MCVVSAMLPQMFPNGPNDPFIPMPGINPYPNMIPWNTVSPDLAMELLDVINKLDALDKKLGNLECKLEGEEKDAIIAKLQEIADGVKK